MPMSYAKGMEKTYVFKNNVFKYGEKIIILLMNNVIIMNTRDANLLS